jgi:ABC-type phosphate/phosphonate transport system permease subunit
MSTDRVTKAVAAAVRSAPCTIRALARLARVPDSTLVRIVAGDRTATPAVAAAVADALEHWSKDCERAARRIRDAQRRGES